ncbi:MAG: ankyrin repeat domain-containing protein [Pseudomonadota bacterium]
MLIMRGANPDQQVYYPSAVRGGFRGTTPFLVAVGAGNLDLVKQLVARGANVELDRIPDWPRLGAPLSTFCVRLHPLPVDPKGP